MRCFDKAMEPNAVADKVTQGANQAAIDEDNIDRKPRSVVGQVNYLNHSVEPDQRAIKRVTRPMPGFKAFQSANSVIAGIELMHMSRQGQLLMEGCGERSFADQFYALVT